MANEATLRHFISNPIDFTVADGATIEKGTVCKLTDPRTAAASSAADVFAGIAAVEKVASDGSVLLSCYVTGIFDMTCNANAGITAGSAVSLSGANLIKLATEAEVVTGAAFGKALETASASEVVQVLIGMAL